MYNNADIIKLLEVEIQKIDRFSLGSLHTSLCEAHTSLKHMNLPMKQ